MNSDSLFFYLLSSLYYCGNNNRIIKLNWTITQVLSFAPDSATATRGEGLATSQKWLSLHKNDRAIWGECKGSGARNYKTSIDLKGPAFKCSCPSRKFPCKHSIALMLLAVQDSEEFVKKEEAPSWVNDWLQQRDQKDKPKKKELDTAEAQQKNQAAKEKNWQNRLSLMSKGVNDLDIWLIDLLRQGLAQTEDQDYAFWNGIATRMVDAKLGGIAKRIKALQLIQGTTADWPAKMLSELSEIYLVSAGFKALDQLPQGLKEELLSVAGVNLQKEVLLKEQGQDGEWMVIGQIEGVEENLNFRRTWLKAREAKQYALILDYSFGNNSYTQHWKVGNIFQGEVIFYPSSFPIRAIVKDKQLKEEHIEGLQGEESIEQFMNSYADALSLNPWIRNFPCCLEGVIPAMQGDELYLIDQQKNKIAVNTNNSAWKLMALSGGHPVTVFGEWTGERLIPLSATFGIRFVDLYQ